MDTVTVSTGAQDFGVFGQLAEYGPIGLLALALGYVAWLFIKRHLAEKDRLQAELDSKKKRKK
jgi:uncharacterized membrane-anchored protein YhcB (DUF1043 family)